MKVRPIQDSPQSKDRLKPWVASEKKPLHQNPYFNVVQQQVRLPDGSKTEFFSIDFPRPAVGIVPIHNGRVLLLRQYRFIVEEFVWAIPSGGIHPGESARQAAARELCEETGHRAKRLRRLQSFYASYGCGNQVFEIYVAENLTPTSEPFDRNEVIGLRWFTRTELMSLVARNGIVDGLSLAPLLLLLLQDASSTPERIKSRKLTPPIWQR
jgi:8-oxo-dGTP pyrophosphatase MutT (NUDIX family)